MPVAMLLGRKVSFTPTTVCQNECIVGNTAMCHQELAAPCHTGTCWSSTTATVISLVCSEGPSNAAPHCHRFPPKPRSGEYISVTWVVTLYLGAWIGVRKIDQQQATLLTRWGRGWSQVARLCLPLERSTEIQVHVMRAAACTHSYAHAVQACLQLHFVLILMSTHSLLSYFLSFFFFFK